MPYIPAGFCLDSLSDISKCRKLLNLLSKQKISFGFILGWDLGLDPNPNTQKGQGHIYALKSLSYL